MTKMKFPEQQCKQLLLVKRQKATFQKIHDTQQYRDPNLDHDLVLFSVGILLQIVTNSF